MIAGGRAGWHRAQSAVVPAENVPLCAAPRGDGTAAVVERRAGAAVTPQPTAVGARSALWLLEQRAVPNHAVPCHAVPNEAVLRWGCRAKLSCAKLSCAKLSCAIHHTKPSCAMPNEAVPCRAMLLQTKLCCSVLCQTKLCLAMQCRAKPGQATPQPHHAVPC